MSFQRVLPVVVLCVVTSCVQPGTTPRPLFPQGGPKVLIYARYWGGLLDRQADASVMAEESAYLLVGHLGGDGRIEILFPEDSRDAGRVRAKQWVRTETFVAYYDAIPSLYSFATTNYRSLGARLDSYDGLGHGFIFVVASRSRLRFERISDFGGYWNTNEALNYRTTPDPRESIREFADMLVVPGQPYTLKFAISDATVASTSLADKSLDCAALLSLGPLLNSGWAYGLGFIGSPFNPWGYASSCGAMYNRYAMLWPWRYYPAVPPSLPPSPQVTPPAPGPAAAPLWRPGRQVGDAGPALGFGWTSTPARPLPPTANDIPPASRPIGRFESDLPDPRRNVGRGTASSGDDWSRRSRDANQYNVSRPATEYRHAPVDRPMHVYRPSPSASPAPAHTSTTSTTSTSSSTAKSGSQGPHH